MSKARTSTRPSSSGYARAWLSPNKPAPTAATQIFFGSPAAALIVCLFPSRRHLVPARRPEGKLESRFLLHLPIQSVLSGQKEAFARRPVQEQSRLYSSSVRWWANQQRVRQSAYLALAC